MMNNYKKLFEQISPRESDEVLISKLMARKAENMKDNDTKKSKNIFLKKAVAIPAAAVLAIGAITVSIGAASGWNFSNLFEKYFSNASTNRPTDDERGKYDITAKLSEMGTNLDETVDFGCGTVHFIGAVADSNAVMVMYELTVNDDVLKEYYSEYSNSGKVPYAGLYRKSGVPGETGYSDPVEIIGEHGVDVVRTDLVYFSNGDLNSSKAIKLYYDTLWLGGDDGSYRELELENPVELSLPLNFMSADKIEVTPNTEIIHDNHRYFLKTVKITPLSIQWTVNPPEIGEREHGPMHNDPIVFRFKDGTEVKSYGIFETAEYRVDHEYHSGVLENPIDVKSLASVTIGDYTINL
ncbi:MAG: hypothetical protein ACI4QY_05655 [Oscillospiraceae bacterium]